MQWDGYVINPAKWSDDLTVDYVETKYSELLYSYSRDKDNNFFIVGNGGILIKE